MRIPILLALAGATTVASAGVTPFTETFNTGSANWKDSTGFADVGWNATGGIGDSGYAFTSFNFVNSVIDDAPALFRAQDEFGSSGNAFVGDWIAGGVDSFSFSFKNDGPAPVGVFVRFSGPFNFPGAIAVVFVPVSPGGWIDITIPIFDGSPNLISYEGTDFNTVFSNVGHVQIGVIVDASLAGLDQTITFGLDNVTITPTPGTLALLGVMGLASLRRRR